MSYLYLQVVPEPCQVWRHEALVLSPLEHRGKVVDVLYADDDPGSGHVGREPAVACLHSHDVHCKVV